MTYTRAEMLKFAVAFALRKLRIHRRKGAMTEAQRYEAGELVVHELRATRGGWTRLYRTTAPARAGRMGRRLAEGHCDMDYQQQDQDCDLNGIQYVRLRLASIRDHGTILPLPFPRQFYARDINRIEGQFVALQGLERDLAPYIADPLPLFVRDPNTRALRTAYQPAGKDRPFGHRNEYLLPAAHRGFKADLASAFVFFRAGGPSSHRVLTGCAHASTTMASCLFRL